LDVVSRVDALFRKTFRVKVPVKNGLRHVGAGAKQGLVSQGVV